MTRRARSGIVPLAAAALILAATACAHDGADPEQRAGEAEGGTTREAAAGDSPASRPSPPAGKLERLEGRRRPATSGAEDSAAPIEAGESEEGRPEDDLIRIEARSSGSPGLVLVRAMDGAQALGYTLLSLREGDLYFVAEKRPSLLGRVVGTQSGICKIAVGAGKELDGDATRVVLKGRAQTSTGRPRCRKDLEEILRYARGEVFRKPKLPAQERKRGRFAPYAR